MDDGHVAVHGHGREREDAHQHGDGEEVVDELADEGTQHPGGEHVDRGLEGDAEEQVGQVGDAQVEDEDVGGAAALAWLAPRQHRDHQRVAQHPQGEDQAEDHQGDEVLDADAKEGLPIRLRQPGEVELPAGRLYPSSGPVEGYHRRLPRLHPPPSPQAEAPVGGKRKPPLLGTENRGEPGAAAPHAGEGGREGGRQEAASAQDALPGAEGVRRGRGSPGRPPPPPQSPGRQSSPPGLAAGPAAPPSPAGGDAPPAAAQPHAGAAPWSGGASAPPRAGGRLLLRETELPGDVSVGKEG